MNYRLGPTETVWKADFYVCSVKLPESFVAMDDPDFPSIYRLVGQSFKDLGVSDLSTVSHSILLHSRSFAGEKFECEGIRAILLRDGKRLVFFGPDGEILKRVNVKEDMPQASDLHCSSRISATGANRLREPVTSVSPVA